MEHTVAGAPYGNAGMRQRATSALPRKPPLGSARTQITSTAAMRAEGEMLKRMNKQAGDIKSARHNNLFET